jgi:hypothetical protein
MDTASQTSTNMAQVVVTVNSAGAPQLAAVNPIVSRMSHGTAGTFDINLPLSGPRGVECRSSTSLGAGNYTMVFTFANNLDSVGSAGITNGGPAMVSSSGVGPLQNQYTVHLSNVPNTQYLSVTLINAKDSTGAIGNVTGTMGVLIGDVNASGVITSGDTNLCKAQALQQLTTNNFRADINASGTVTTGDVNLIKQHALEQLPTSP